MKPRERLQRRNFRLFLASQVAAQAGTWLQFVAVAWLAGQSTGSGTALGWVAAATFGPLLLLGPWAGALADRLDKRRLLIATQLLMAVQAVGLGAAVLAGRADMPVIYALTLLYGVINAGEAPVRRALVAELVEQEAIARAVSLTNVVAALGRVLGPLAAGGLIATAGTGWCFVATAVSYLVALIALLPIDDSVSHKGGARREPGAVRAGLRYVWRNPEMRIALILTAVVATFGFNHQVLIPLLAAKTFHGGPAAYTLLYTGISVGSVLGALAVARRRDISLTLLVRAVVAFALANAVLAFAPTLAVGVIGSFGGGVTALLFITASAALLQQQSDPAMRGRVMALFAIVLMGGVPIGAPLVGVLADVAGPRAAVAAGSVAVLLAACCVARRTGVRGPGRRATWLVSTDAA